MQKQVLLPREVENFYFKNLDTISRGKRAHWLMRHYSWFQDQLSRDLLDEHRSDYVKPTEEGMRREYKRALNNIPTSKISDPVLIEKKEHYYETVAVMRTMLKCLFAYTYFGEDTRAAFIKAMPREEAADIRERLIRDPKNVVDFYVPAPNTLYISEWIYGFKRLDAQFYLDIAKKEINEKDPFSIQRVLYMLTHAIIGETLFYSKKIRRQLGVYRSMMRMIDGIIYRNMKTVRLDIKVEAVMCSRMLNMRMKSEDGIMREAEKSRAEDGSYIIDTHNTFAGTLPSSPSFGEHKNILYVMAGSQAPDYLRSKK